MTNKPKNSKFAYVKNHKGFVYDIPIDQLAETLKRKGFEFICYVEDEKSLIEDLFNDDFKDEK